MRTSITFAVVLFILALAPTAQAQEATGGGGGGAATSSGIGVGIQTMLSGPGGPAFVYQGSGFHVTGILTFDTGVDEDLFSDEIGVAGRFYYELHSGEISDFSVGGGFGVEDDAGGNDDIDIHLEAGGQIRAFITPNVALSATLGLAIEFDDDNNNGDDDLDFALTGQLNALFGVTYFFF